MERALLLLLVLSSMTTVLVDGQGGAGHGDEQSQEGPNHVKLHVKPQGGQVRLYRSLPPRPGKQDRRKTGEIRIWIGRIRETNGTEIERGDMAAGPPPLPIKFQVSKLPNKSLRDNIKGDCLKLRAPLKHVNGSVLTVYLCLIKDNGTITLDDEDIEVRSGQMKFSVHLENWPWKDVNNFIDIDIIMKVPKGRQVVRRSPSAGASRKKPAEFGLGKNATAYFSRKVKRDNASWEEMPDEFPSTPRKKGDDYVIRLRFPYFNETAFYDPIIDLTGEDPEEAEPSPPSFAVQTARNSILALSTGVLLGFVASKLAL